MPAIHDDLLNGLHPRTKEALELLDAAIDAVDPDDASDITFTATGNIVATTVQDAVVEVDAEKVSKIEITDSTTGTAGDTFAAGVGKYLLSIPVNLATVADGDVLTALPIPHKFKILSVDAYVTQEVTTADKLTSLNVEIGSTDVTGGVVALTSANTATLGAKVAGSAVTAANTGAAAATISIEAATTTAFAEGEVVVVIGIQNMDVADAFATIATSLLDA